MNSLISKFFLGIKTDTIGTLVKTISYGMRIIREVIADGLYLIFRLFLLPMPARTLAQLKHDLSPKAKLDYQNANILLQVDSLYDIVRARPCWKEPETVRWIEGYLKQNDVFYDVGANIGAYSLIASKHNYDRVVVHAFEPSFSTYQQLCRNIILNGCHQNIIPHMICLTDKPGLNVFHYHSLEAGGADHQLGGSPSDSSSQRFVYNQQILSFSLDYLVDRFGFPLPNHIKLDIDGGEVAALHGAVNTLECRELRSVLVEVRTTGGIDEKVNEILKSYNFYLVEKVDRGDGITWNCIYVRE